MKIRVNKTFSNIEESATLAINQNIKYLRSKGKTVYHLGFGESPFPVPETVKLGLRSGENIKSYQQTQGLALLREAISEFYQEWFDLKYSYENIFIGPGSKELIFDLMLLIDGDLMLPVPSWVSYIPQAKIAGKSAIKIETSIDNNYCMTVEELDKAYNIAINDGLNPKLLLINTPGNPCGNSYTESNVKAISEYARQKQIYIISDEIYANIIFKNYRHTSFAKYYPEGTFVTGGMSKDRSLGGYRIGVCLIPDDQPEFKKAFNTLISETFSCVSAPIQYAALHAYTNDCVMSNFITNCTKIHNIVLNYFYNQLMESEYIECSPPMGAFYLYPKYNIGKIKTSQDLSKVLLEEYNVASLPGSCFGQSPLELTTRLAITDYDGSAAYEYFINSSHINESYFIEKYCSNLVIAVDLIKQMVKKHV
ncbi:MAG: pyridoxal phosphate-dependent aminotransferase [Vampirovibrionia bacterium]